MSAPADLAATRTFSVPFTLTLSGKSYRNSDRSDARMIAAVWNTVRGRCCADSFHGLRNEAVTAAAEEISVCMNSTSLAGKARRSSRCVSRISRMRMFSGGVPRASSCNTIKPPTKPRSRISHFHLGNVFVDPVHTIPAGYYVTTMKPRGQLVSIVYWPLLQLTVRLPQLLGFPAAWRDAAHLRRNNVEDIVDPGQIEQ
jgi:hypothetical protein